MAKKETDPIKLRTVSMYVKYQSISNKIFEYLSHQSKNLYNYSMFAINVFKKYKNEIYKEIYYLMKYTEYFRDTEDLEEYLYESNYQEVFTDILRNILKSIYIKNFLPY